MGKVTKVTNDGMVLNAAFLIPLIIMLIITYVSAFDKHGKPTCERYLLNSYLYAVTYLFMMAWFIILLVQYNFALEDLNIYILIAIALFNIAVVVIIYFTPKEYVALKHILSVLFVATSAIFLHFIFTLYDLKSIMFMIVMTIILFIILTVITWKYQDMISSKIPFLVFIIFIILLVCELIVGIFMPGSILEKAIITIALLFICYLLLVKTKKMIEKNRTCVKDNGPDYVNNGVSLVISFENIFHS